MTTSCTESTKWKTNMNVCDCWHPMLSLSGKNINGITYLRKRTYF